MERERYKYKGVGRRSTGIQLQIRRLGRAALVPQAFKEPCCRSYSHSVGAATLSSVSRTVIQSGIFDRPCITSLSTSPLLLPSLSSSSTPLGSPSGPQNRRRMRRGQFGLRPCNVVAEEPRLPGRKGPCNEAGLHVARSQINREFKKSDFVPNFDLLTPASQFPLRMLPKRSNTA